MAVTKRERKKTLPKKAGRATNGKPQTMAGISLPTKRNVPPEKMTDFSFFIFGEKGIGKSSLAAMWPDAVTFMFERGRRNLKIFQVPKPGEPALDWPRFKGYVDLVIAKGQRPIIDTVDYAYDACFYHVLKTQFSGVTHPSQADESYAAWDAIRMEWEQTFDAFLDAGLRPVAISHAKNRKERPRTGGEYDQIVPTCTPGCFKYFKSRFDVIGYYGYYGHDRWLTIRGNDELIDTAVGIVDHFLTPDGTDIASLPMGTSVRESWKNLQAAWNNKLADCATAEDEEEAEEEE